VVSKSQRQQHTISAPVRVSGQGIHSGRAVEVQLAPATAGHGITFERSDLPTLLPLLVEPDALESGQRCTAIASAEGLRVRTIEHLLAACRGLGVDNLAVSLDAEELPIFDGSALAWVEALHQARIVSQTAERRHIAIDEPVLYSHGETTLMALPYEGLRLSVASVTDHPIAGKQMVDLEITPDSFEKHLALARTFCFWEEVEPLLAAGLARGGSLDNALVIKRDGFSRPLRTPTELAAHKALDLLGDLAVLGADLAMHVVAVCPGHTANQKLVRSIWGQYSAKQAPPLAQASRLTADAGLTGGTGRTRRVG
jgi:UDP-3-O-[3-hydroxymyristoyl] N-acetylglucosamine deacetylase/3-hydroxyacyl-[acyl-carrier-protein] dehydratase